MPFIRTVPLQYHASSTPRGQAFIDDEHDAYHLPDLIDTESRGGRERGDDRTITVPQARWLGGDADNHPRVKIGTGNVNDSNMHVRQLTLPTGIVIEQKRSARNNMRSRRRKMRAYRT